MSTQQNKKFEEILKEFDDTYLQFGYCANCHRRHTWGQMKYGVSRGETLFPLLVAEVAKRCVLDVGKTI